MAAMNNMFLRKGRQRAVEQRKIPAPGEGPKERIRREIYVSRIIVAEAEEPGPRKRTAHCVMSAGPGGMGEPYECTAVVSLEAASCILDALQEGGKTLRPGFGTTTYHLAHLGFCERLKARGYHHHVAEGFPPQELFRNVLECTKPVEA